MTVKGTLLKQRLREALSHRERRIIIADGFSPAAVLLPIYEKDGEYHILFTKRTQKVEHHKGQISFPGGVYDAGDSDLAATALRETFEEIGVCPADVEVLGQLDTQTTRSSNFAVLPLVGAITYPCQFTINRIEVEELIEVPLSALSDRDCLREEPPDYESGDQPRYFYYYRDHVIWGLTARILKQFLDVVFM